MAKFYYTIFNLLILSAIIYTGIDAFYRVLSEQLQQISTEEIVMQDARDDKRRVREKLNDFEPIMARNIFGSLARAPVEPPKPEIETLEPTTLKIELLGTAWGDPQSTVAIIKEVRKKKQGLYREGDSVQNAVIKKILRGRVILGVGDKDEVLVMKEPTPSIGDSVSEARGQTDSPENTITVRREEINQSLENINDLMSQAAIRPYFTRGQADGLAITRIKPGSIFGKMGLKNGDIVQGVNGKEIKTPDDLISLYNDLKSLESDISLQLKRRGEEISLDYQFTD